MLVANYLILTIVPHQLNTSLLCASCELLLACELALASLRLRACCAEQVQVQSLRQTCGKLREVPTRIGEEQLTELISSADVLLLLRVLLTRPKVDYIDPSGLHMSWSLQAGILNPS